MLAVAAAILVPAPATARASLGLGSSYPLGLRQPFVASDQGFVIGQLDYEPAGDLDNEHGYAVFA